MAPGFTQKGVNLGRLFRPIRQLNSCAPGRRGCWNYVVLRCKCPSIPLTCLTTLLAPSSIQPIDHAHLPLSPPLRFRLDEVKRLFEPTFSPSHPSIPSTHIHTTITQEKTLTISIYTLELPFYIVFVQHCFAQWMIVSQRCCPYRWPRG